MAGPQHPFRRVGIIVTGIALLISGIALVWTLQHMSGEIEALSGGNRDVQSAQPGRPPLAVQPGGADGRGQAPGGGNWNDPRRGSDLRHPPARNATDALRDRIIESAYLSRCAKAGSAEAVEQVKKRLESELDPRVRHALKTGEQIPIPRTRYSPPVLPEPAKAADPGEVDAYWLTPERDGTYQSKVTVDAEGHATVETVYEPKDGGIWHVRYGGWAWRDAKGNLVVDARGQEVDVIRHPPNGWWSPDSMVIGPDGMIELIDDKHDPGQGSTGAKGPG